MEQTLLVFTSLSERDATRRGRGTIQGFSIVDVRREMRHAFANTE